MPRRIVCLIAGRSAVGLKQSSRQTRDNVLLYSKASNGPAHPLIIPCGLYYSYQERAQADPRLLLRIFRVKPRLPLQFSVHRSMPVAYDQTSSFFAT